MTMPDDERALLRSAALQNAASIRLARERAERRQEAYLAEAQRLSHTGSFGWKASTGEIVWSEETFRIFQYDRTTQPTVERVLARVHPQDAALVRQTIERASQDGKDFEHEYRLVMPDGFVKHVHVVAHASSDASGEPEFVGAVMDVTDRKRAEMLQAGEKRLLEMIALGDARAPILDAICRLVEELASGTLASILLLDHSAKCLRHGAAPSLPTAYTEAIDGAVIGPSAGSCGTAAYRREPVMVSDIATDPLWADYRQLALAHGLRACWSTPILSADGEVLGTFAIYYRKPRSPTAQERGLIQQTTHLASIALEREQAEQVLREQASLLDLTHDTVFVRDMQDVITYWNRGAEELYGWTSAQAIGKTTHELLGTGFPEPLEQMMEKLLRTGRWEGELVHTKRDGTPVSVASRWALQRDERGNAVAVLETNNDITERKRSEAELLRQTALLDELFVGGPDAVALSSLEKRVVRVNREFGALFGYAAEEVVGVSLADLIVPDDELERSLAARARAQITIGRVAFEGMRRRKDGSLIQVSIKGGPIVLRGQPIGYYAMYRDITERKRNEAEVLHKTALLDELFEGSPDAVVLLDMEARVLRISREFAALFGYTAEEAAGRLIVDLIVPEDEHANSRAGLARALAGERFTDERERRRKDGTRIHVSIKRAQIVLGGKPIGYYGIYRDITERKRAEEELRLSEERYALAMLAAEDAHWDWIVGTDRYYLSPRTLDLFGLPPDTVFTSREDYLARTPLVREDLEKWQRAVAELFAGTGSRLSMEVRAIVRGEIRWLLHVGVCMRDASGRAVRWCGTARDITEQRAREREREEMERQLQKAAKMEAIGRLAGGIAHDFNNILGAILGYGELAQKNLEGRAVRRHVDQVMQAGARGKGLVERILAFSRAGLGERAPVHVQAVVEETLELLAASLPAGARLEKALDAGDAAVVGDATQLHQVVMNLCTNAIHVIEHGGVLTVRLDRVDVPGRRLLSHGALSARPYVRLSVSDTGCGIPPAVLERMFDPFFTTKRVGDGTGLGLSLVHGIVADFGGAIDVATQAGAGSTFTVWLPAAGETPRPLEKPAAEVPRGNGETVMIVDDERALVALAEETLAELGYEPAGFDSSLAALEAFRAEPGRFDLVLTDQTMPDLSGVELISEIRRVRPELPIVLMSGYSGPQLTERAHAAGAGEVLRKPLVRGDIAEALGRALNLRPFPP